MPPNGEVSQRHEEAASEIDSFIANSPPGSSFNPYTLIAEELLHVPTGSTVPDPNSVVGESGRSYHGYKEGSYLLPNDAPEQDRLDFQHAITTFQLDGRLALAPLPEAPQLVLDLVFTSFLPKTTIYLSQFTTPIAAGLMKWCSRLPGQEYGHSNSRVRIPRPSSLVLI